jgi:uncharacterized protein YjcR
VRNPIYKTVAKLVCSGYRRKDIAEALGMKVTNVHNHIKYARSIGVDAQFDRNSVLLSRAPPHIEQWLREQAPQGATAGDVILAILNDAYNEDMDDESKQTENA